MYIYPTNLNEISDIVSNLKSNKSACYDEISPNVMKSVIPYISKPLCEIVNISFYIGKFPDKLKIAKVSPVFKSDNKLLVNNYRPISVLQVFSKILERLRYNRFVVLLKSKGHIN